MKNQVSIRITSETGRYAANYSVHFLPHFSFEVHLQLLAEERVTATTKSAKLVTAIACKMWAVETGTRRNSVANQEEIKEHRPHSYNRKAQALH